MTTRRPLSAGAGLMACALLLSGCTNNQPAPEATDSATLTPTASPSTTEPTKAEKAEAEAIQVVKDLAQMVIVDIFAGTSTLDDLAHLASDDYLEQQQVRSQGLLAAGWRAKPGQQTLVTNLQVKSISPKSDPDTVVIRYCDDGRGVRYYREEAGKKVTEHGVAEGWEVTVTRTTRGWRASGADYKESACEH
ncbi:MAG: hypothetical protein ACOYEV_18470 [Candidatus Nanopelagicales bacterium]